MFNIEKLFKIKTEVESCHVYFNIETNQDK